MKVSFLGPAGSFSHQVVQKLFPQAAWVACDNLTEVIKAYEHGQTDYAVVPIENSIEGSVLEVLDYLFHQAAIHAVAEVVQPIKQQLMATDRTKPIEKVFSHPQALAQGKQYIRQHYPQAEMELMPSTAYAARFVAQHPEKNYAAIAPEAAAVRYDLEILAQDIQEISENYTRFWVLGEVAPVVDWAAVGQKISLALTLPDNMPGALYKALAVFSWRGINLTKIESRPLKTALGEYFFILDALVPNQDLLHFALMELETMGIVPKILGTYAFYQF